jgi:hypothetical protein
MPAVRGLWTQRENSMLFLLLLLPGGAPGSLEIKFSRILESLEDAP